MQISVKFSELEIDDEFYMSHPTGPIKAKKVGKGLAVMKTVDGRDHVFQINHLAIVQIVKNE